MRVKCTECWHFYRQGTRLLTTWPHEHALKCILRQTRLSQHDSVILVYTQQNSHLDMSLVSALPGRCGAKSSSPVPALFLYPWNKPPHQEKPSPSQLLVPRLTTAASFRKATQPLMPLYSPPSWTSRTWDNAPSPQPPPLHLWMDTGVSCWKYRFHVKWPIMFLQNLEVIWATF